MIPTFQFDIVTLSGNAYSGRVRSLRLPGKEGSFGVLANHAALIGACSDGPLKITNDAGETVWYHVGKGFFEVVKNKAILLAASAVVSSPNALIGDLDSRT